MILNGEPWRGRGAAGEIGHMVVRRNGAQVPVRAAWAAWRPTPAARRWSSRPAAAITRGEKTALFKIMEKKGRTALTSGVWAEALEHDDKLAVDLIDRALAALGAGIASAVNLLDVEAVVIGGGLGTRLGDPYVGPHQGADAPAPVRRRPPAGGARGRPRRPRRRDRRRPARQDLNTRGLAPCIHGGQCLARKSTTRCMRSMRRSGRAVAIITWCSSG